MSIILECERPGDNGLFFQREIQDITPHHVSTQFAPHLASGDFFYQIVFSITMIIIVFQMENEVKTKS